jgi:hypothetical protein
VVQASNCCRNWRKRENMKRYAPKSRKQPLVSDSGAVDVVTDGGVRLLHRSFDWV